ncbi:msl6057 [Mesorhizobium japonicum MAFF 303099]|uniref:Msl6057 protein n=1 Tax=Mesorhizobium japonicum (strain LMG 29417 / CECT 9101 / MAFF 303099) TaxID=266835 RepID=Q98AD0_RHILO|nr:msl6057 [Mesorhizobium japonicum MAFF 303099]
MGFTAESIRTLRPRGSWFLIAMASSASELLPIRASSIVYAIRSGGYVDGNEAVALLARPLKV